METHTGLTYKAFFFQQRLQLSLALSSDNKKVIQTAGFCLENPSTTRCNDVTNSPASDGQLLHKLCQIVDKQEVPKLI
jgi:hypothetical protein